MQDTISLYTIESLSPASIFVHYTEMIESAVSHSTVNERVERINFLSFISLPDCCLVAVFFCLKMLTISKLEIQLELWRRSRSLVLPRSLVLSLARSVSLALSLCLVLLLSLSLSILLIIWTGNTDTCIFKHQFNDLMHLMFDNFAKKKKNVFNLLNCKVGQKSFVRSLGNRLHLHLIDQKSERPIVKWNGTCRWGFSFAGKSKLISKSIAVFSP